MRWTLFPFLATLLIAATPARSDDDHERARDAMAAGEIVPLRQILDRATRDFPGEMLEVELEHGAGGQWIYELKVLAPQGNILELEYDARTMDLIKAEGDRD